MSLESKIDRLTDTLIAVNNTLAALMTQQQATQVVPQAAAPVAPVAPAAPVQQAPEVPSFAAPAAPPAAMPPLPSFAPPAAPAAPAVPFNDGPSLVNFVMTKYKELEAKAPGTGAGIQNVLTGLGYQNINEVKPEHYPAFYAGVQAL